LVRGLSFRFAWLLAAAVLPQVAHAQTLAIDGVWGNEPGCKYARDGNYEDDTMLVLKPDSVEGYVVACEWLQVLTAKDGKQVASGICNFEGDEGVGARTYVIAKDPKDAGLIRIFNDQGDLWEEVRKCP
jgi:hypothetical protein